MIDPRGQVNTSRDLLQVTEQDDVALLCATRDGQLFPVARPGVAENLVAREVGQLLGLAAFERLAPEVAHALACQGVHQAVAVAGPLQIRSVRSTARREGGFATVYGNDSGPEAARLRVLPCGRNQFSVR